MGEFTNITAAILAGGLGTRLRPRVSGMPKVLAQVLGRPFITFILDHLAQMGLKQVVILTGYKGTMVKGCIGSGWQGMRISYSQENTKLDTGGALRFALPQLQTQRVLVLNGDSFFTAGLQPLARFHRARGAKVSLMLTQVDDVSRYGGVEIRAGGEVTAFVEKNGKGGPGWINAGIYIMDRQVIEAIPSSMAVSLEREVFPAWIGRGLYAHQAQGAFLDIGLPETHARADRFFAEVGP